MPQPTIYFKHGFVNNLRNSIFPLVNTNIEDKVLAAKK